MRAWSKRFWVGALWGLVATLLMTLAMGLLALVGDEELLEPMPLVLIARIFAHVSGAAATSAGVVLVAFLVHFIYGAVASGFLAVTTARITVGRGLLLGVALWAIMMVFFIPMSGAHTFRLATDPLFWATSIGLHLIYGLAVGVLVERHESHRDEDLVQLFTD
jgi:hypothetical protein